MKNERHHSDWDAAEAAVWLLAADDASAASADAATRALADELRGVDVALRSLALAESPDAHEVRRMRDAALRTTRLHAAEAMQRRTLSLPSGRRRIPRWPLAGAAAAAVIVGFVVWVVNQSPAELATSNSIVGTTAGAPTADGAEADARDRQAWRDQFMEYYPLVAAFDDVEPAEPVAPDNLDEIDSQISALSMLGGTVDN